MATITLRAIAPPQAVPLSWGNNTIVTSNITNRFDDPQWLDPTAQIYGVYRFLKTDFTVDTFPQFKANPGFDLVSIYITEIVLSPDVRFTRNGHDISVGDELIIDDGSQIWIDNRKLSSTDMTLGYFKYLNSEDGFNYDLSTESTMNLMILPATDAFLLDFGDVWSPSFPKGKKSSVLLKNYTSDYRYFSDANTGLWQANTANFNSLNQYITDTGNEKPYKIEIFSNVDKRLTFLGQPLVLNQKIPIGLIQAGFLQVDFTTNQTPFSFEFRFGDAYTGSFRLNPL